MLDLISIHIYTLLAHTEYFMDCNFACFFPSADLFQNQLFRKIISGITSGCQTVWIQIRPDKMSGLIWVQTVWKGYKQMTKVAASKERVNYHTKPKIWTKRFLFIIYSLPTIVPSANFLCKQFGPRSGLTKFGAWSESKLSDTDGISRKNFLKKVDIDMLEIS